MTTAWAIVIFAGSYFVTPFLRLWYQARIEKDLLAIRLEGEERQAQIGAKIELGGNIKASHKTED